MKYNTENKNKKLSGIQIDDYIKLVDAGLLPNSEDDLFESKGILEFLNQIKNVFQKMDVMGIGSAKSSDFKNWLKEYSHSVKEADFVSSFAELNEEGALEITHFANLVARGLVQLPKEPSRNTNKFSPSSSSQNTLIQQKPVVNNNKENIPLSNILEQFMTYSPDSLGYITSESLESRFTIKPLRPEFSAILAQAIREKSKNKLDNRVSFVEFINAFRNGYLSLESEEVSRINDIFIIAQRWNATHHSSAPLKIYEKWMIDNYQISNEIISEFFKFLDLDNDNRVEIRDFVSAVINGFIPLKIGQEFKIGKIETLTKQFSSLLDSQNQGYNLISKDKFNIILNDNCPNLPEQTIVDITNSLKLLTNEKGMNLLQFKRFTDLPVFIAQPNKIECSQIQNYYNQITSAFNAINNGFPIDFPSFSQHLQKSLKLNENQIKIIWNLCFQNKDSGKNNLEIDRKCMISLFIRGVFVLSDLETIASFQNPKNNENTIIKLNLNELKLIGGNNEITEGRKCFRTFLSFFSSGIVNINTKRSLFMSYDDFIGGLVQREVDDVNSKIMADALRQQLDSSSVKIISFHRFRNAYNLHLVPHGESEGLTKFHVNIRRISDFFDTIKQDIPNWIISVLDADEEMKEIISNYFGKQNAINLSIFIRAIVDGIIPFDALDVNNYSPISHQQIFMTLQLFSNKKLPYITKTEFSLGLHTHFPSISAEKRELLSSFACNSVAGINQNQDECVIPFSRFIDLCNLKLIPMKSRQITEDSVQDTLGRIIFSLQKLIHLDSSTSGITPTEVSKYFTDSQISETENKILIKLISPLNGQNSKNPFVDIPTLIDIFAKDILPFNLILKFKPLPEDSKTTIIGKTEFMIHEVLRSFVSFTPNEKALIPLATIQGYFQKKSPQKFQSFIPKITEALAICSTTTITEKGNENKNNKKQNVGSRCSMNLEGFLMAYQNKILKSRLENVPQEGIDHVEFIIKLYENYLNSKKPLLDLISDMKFESTEASIILEQLQKSGESSRNQEVSVSSFLHDSIYGILPINNNYKLQIQKSLQLFAPFQKFEKSSKSSDTRKHQIKELHELFQKKYPELSKEHIDILLGGLGIESNGLSKFSLIQFHQAVRNGILGDSSVTQKSLKAIESSFNRAFKTMKPLKTLKKSQFTQELINLGFNDWEIDVIWKSMNLNDEISLEKYVSLFVKGILSIEMIENSSAKSHKYVSTRENDPDLWNPSFETLKYFLKLYSYLDINQDKSLSLSEIEPPIHRSISRIFGSENKLLEYIPSIISKLDKDKNGVIDFEEFVLIVQKGILFYQKEGKEEIKESSFSEIIVSPGVVEILRTIDYLKKESYTINGMKGYLSSKFLLPEESLRFIMKKSGLDSDMMILTGKLTEEDIISACLSGVWPILNPYPDIYRNTISKLMQQQQQQQKDQEKQENIPLTITEFTFETLKTEIKERTKLSELEINILVNSVKYSDILTVSDVLLGTMRGLISDYNDGFNWNDLENKVKKVIKLISTKNNNKNEIKEILTVKEFSEICVSKNKLSKTECHIICESINPDHSEVFQVSKLLNLLLRSVRIIKKIDPIFDIKKVVKTVKEEIEEKQTLFSNSQQINFLNKVLIQFVKYGGNDNGYLPIENLSKELSKRGVNSDDIQVIANAYSRISSESDNNNNNNKNIHFNDFFIGLLDGIIPISDIVTPNVTGHGTIGISKINFKTKALIEIFETMENAMMRYPIINQNKNNKKNSLLSEKIIDLFIREIDENSDGFISSTEWAVIRIKGLNLLRITDARQWFRMINILSVYSKFDINSYSQNQIKGKKLISSENIRVTLRGLGISKNLIEFIILTSTTKLKPFTKSPFATDLSEFVQTTLFDLIPPINIPVTDETSRTQIAHMNWVKSLFNLLDVDQSGSISINELKILLESANIIPKIGKIETANILFSSSNVWKNGELTEQEFASQIQRQVLPLVSLSNKVLVSYKRNLSTKNTNEMKKSILPKDVPLLIDLNIKPSDLPKKFEQTPFNSLIFVSHEFYDPNTGKVDHPESHVTHVLYVKEGVEKTSLIPTIPEGYCVTINGKTVINNKNSAEIKVGLKGPSSDNIAVIVITDSEGKINIYVVSLLSENVRDARQLIVISGTTFLQPFDPSQPIWNVCVDKNLKEVTITHYLSTTLCVAINGRTVISGKPSIPVKLLEIGNQEKIKNKKSIKTVVDFIVTDDQGIDKSYKINIEKCDNNNNNGNVNGNVDGNVDGNVNGNVDVSVNGNVDVSGNNGSGSDGNIKSLKDKNGQRDLVEHHQNDNNKNKNENVNNNLLNSNKDDEEKEIKEIKNNNFGDNVVDSSGGVDSSVGVENENENNKSLLSSENEKENKNKNENNGNDDNDKEVTMLNENLSSKKSKGKKSIDFVVPKGNVFSKLKYATALKSKSSSHS